MAESSRPRPVTLRATSAQEATALINYGLDQDALDSILVVVRQPLCNNGCVEWHRAVVKSLKFEVCALAERKQESLGSAPAAVSSVNRRHALACDRRVRQHILTLLDLLHVSSVRMWRVICVYYMCFSSWGA